jgi:predicted dehydrogenase
MTPPASRRDFLQTTALAGVGFWVAGGLTAAPSKQPGPNERVNVAVIGAGGQGASNTNNVAKLANLVALCDVDDVRAAPTYRQFPKVPVYHDFRAMLEKQKDIDAVIVATPDNLHAHASIMAMRLGKHVYCEKPLTHDIAEARLMKETAQKHKVATQMGNQGTSSTELRRAVEVVQAGALGDVREVHVWTNRPTWPQNIARPKGTPAVPKTLAWDLWLGPAPERPYQSAYLPFNWRGWWDFGTGAIGDMACHTMNLPYMALRLGYPTSVVAELDTPLSTETAPMGCRVTYEFPVRGKLPAVTLHWYERRRPPEKLFMGQKFRASGALLVGSRGTLYSASDYGTNNRLLPEQNFRDFKDPNPTLPRSPGHHREWLNAIRGGPAAMSNFVDYSAQFAEVVLLGNVAIRVGGKRVVWDSAKMLATDLPAADPFIRREYRKGWTL